MEKGPCITASLMSITVLVGLLGMPSSDAALSELAGDPRQHRQLKQITGLERDTATLSAEELDTLGVPLNATYLFHRVASCAPNSPTVIRARVLLLCQVTPVLERCLPETNGTLFFPKCKNNTCQLKLTNEETLCLSDWVGIDLNGTKNKEEAFCNVPSSEADLLNFGQTAFTTPVTDTLGGHCFLAFPNDSIVLAKIGCFNDLPQLIIRWEFDFPRQPEEFGCFMSAKCREGILVGESVCWYEGELPGENKAGLMGTSIWLFVVSLFLSSVLSMTDILNH